MSAAEAPIAAAVRAMIATRKEWAGTASDLLVTLEETAGDRVAKSKTATALSGRLRPTATCLREIGIDFVFKKEGRTRTRIIHITNTQSLAAPENALARPSASSALTPKTNPANGIAALPLRTVVSDAEDSRNGNALPARATPLRNNVKTAADGTVANPPPQSSPEHTRASGWSAQI